MQHSEQISFATTRRQEEDQVRAAHTPSDELSRLLGLDLGDGTSFEGSSCTRVQGDYYRDPDDITRSTRMGSGQAGPGEVFKSAFPAPGDFYVAEGKVVGGVTLPVGDHFSMDSDHWQVSSCGLGGPGVEMDPNSKAFAHGGFSSRNVELSTAKAQYMGTTYFSGDASPPTLPDDEFFSLCDTTLHLVCDTPNDIGNCLLDFLANEVTSSVTKVRREKFCIKADVFKGNSMCTMKIRVWKQASPDRVAMEFQRRRGDVATFNGVFQHASTHLQSHFEIVGDIPLVSSVLCAPPPLPPSLDLPSKGDVRTEIGPILHMAGQTHNRSIQAESAVMLADFTEDERKTALCTPQAALAVTTLLKEDAIEVALPTARIVLALSTCSAAIPYFIASGQETASSGFLDLSIEKNRSCTSSLVRRTLAQAVAIAIDACVVHLSHEQASQLNTAISAVIRATSKECGLPGAAADNAVTDQSLKSAASLLAASR